MTSHIGFVIGVTTLFLLDQNEKAAKKTNIAINISHI
jgi:hypothetical protein